MKWGGDVVLYTCPTAAITDNHPLARAVPQREGRNETPLTIAAHVPAGDCSVDRSVGLFVHCVETSAQAAEAQTPGENGYGWYGRNLSRLCL
jgi:hypothetical protein